uniref:Uncharacterized protein n=1 Tax=Cajanus cajan TaxID=3821 RepID=A0A151R7M7_CAJCA|nr:hypothetical protein KK1_040243 [Cajanus cajan]
MAINGLKGKKEFSSLYVVRLGFCYKWCNCIRECLVTTRVSVLVNESPSTEFSSQKGIRQGDPLAPILFLVVVEDLSNMMRVAME